MNALAETIARTHPLLRGLVALAVFGLAMALPVWGLSATGREGNLLLMSWFTPFVIGLALLPVHLAFARWLLTTVLQVTVLAFTGVFVTSVLVHVLTQGEMTVGQTLAHIGRGFGGLFYLGAIILLAPYLFEDAHRAVRYLVHKPD
ncbi:hypothetical protein [Maricaulis parjimensis]|uniref:hypothetical protein n=1 Tax=Maricaulis parjimensis TaxID=144023 RepID=UPI00193A6FAE|nr:hypothetical protein [Maricaulis parjimensis]